MASKYKKCNSFCFKPPKVKGSPEKSWPLINTLLTFDDLQMLPILSIVERRSKGRFLSSPLFFLTSYLHFFSFSMRCVPLTEEKLTERSLDKSKGRDYWALNNFDQHRSMMNAPNQIEIYRSMNAYCRASGTCGWRVWTAESRQHVFCECRLTVPLQCDAILQILSR